MQTLSVNTITSLLAIIDKYGVEGKEHFNQ